MLLSLGYFSLSLLDKNNFYWALAIITIGNGFFMPNIVSCVGEIYRANDPLRESGFSIFYTAINIGAFLPPFITAGIIAKFGWQIAFFISSLSMLLSTILFYIAINRFPHILHNTNSPSRNKNLKFILSMMIGIIGCIFLSTQLIEHNQITSAILFLVSTLFVIYAIKEMLLFSAIARNRLLVCFILTGFSIIFWMLSEQTAMSLTIYTEYNVQRSVGHYAIPTIFFFSLNPLFIIILGPLFSKLWNYLEEKKLNPSTPIKFSLGTILMGLGFVILPLAIAFKDVNGQINLAWIVLSYFLQSSGELLLSPVGLAMITELTPKKMIGLMVGIWYLATAIAYLFAGFAAKWTTIQSEMNMPLNTSPVYAHVFGMLGWITISVGIIILFLAPFLNRMMQEIESFSDEGLLYAKK